MKIKAVQCLLAIALCAYYGSQTEAGTVTGYRFYSTPTVDCYLSIGSCCGSTKNKLGLALSSTDDEQNVFWDCTSQASDVALWVVDGSKIYTESISGKKYYLQWSSALSSYNEQNAKVEKDYGDMFEISNGQMTSSKNCKLQWDYELGHYTSAISGSTSVLGREAKFDCASGVVGDPFTVVPAGFSFSGKSGSWNLLHSCPGCTSNEYQKTEGVSFSKEQSVSSEFTASLSVSVSAGFEFMGADTSVEVSAGVSSTTAQSMTTAMSKSLAQMSKFVCKKSKFYQFQIAAMQTVGKDLTSLTVHGSQFLCTDLTPKCPAGLCSDTDCQQCTQSLSAVVIPMSPEWARLLQPSGAAFILVMSALVLFIAVQGLMLVRGARRCLREKSANKVVSNKWSTLRTASSSDEDESMDV